MGKLLGVDASTIGSWEKNEHIPSAKKLDHLEKIVIYLSKLDKICSLKRMTRMVLV